MGHSRQTILDCLRAGKPALMQQFPLHRLALFGSYARDEFTTVSDIDILVDVDPSIGLGFVTLAEQLEQLLGQKVDLVSRRAVKPALWKFIERDLIYV